MIFIFYLVVYRGSKLIVTFIRFLHILKDEEFKSLLKSWLSLLEKEAKHNESYMREDRHFETKPLTHSSLPNGNSKGICNEK